MTVAPAGVPQLFGNPTAPARRAPPRAPRRRRARPPRPGHASRKRRNSERGRRRAHVGRL